MINYFEFLGIEPSFFPDLVLLKQQFYKKSREVHPDFYTTASEEDKQKALEQASILNVAYKTLLNPNQRFQHILLIEGEIQADSKDEMQQSFLMDMMDFNEEIMELQFDFSKDKYTSLKTELDKIKNQAFSDKKEVMKRYPDVNREELGHLKNLYFENKYLSRLEDNLEAMNQNS